MWIERNFTKKIEEAVYSRPVVLLTGPRQVGKSSILQKMYKEAEYITLDRVLMAAEARENPTDFLGRFNDRVIIDEIQYAPSLFRELKIRIDEERGLKGKWILTGSQQFTLMENASESLAGRVRILNMGTLSATELQHSGLLKNEKDLIWKGGYPEIWAETINTRDYFEDYIQTYLERDLKQILNVKNLRDYRRFISLLALRTGQLLNYSEISKELGVSVNTIKSWVSTLEVSGLLILLPPYYNNLGKRLIKSPKVYFSDNGLVSAMLNINSMDILEVSPHYGNLWENFVLNEFTKAGYIPGKDLFYFRDQNGVEIDFVVEKDGLVNLIEAKKSEYPDQGKFNFRKVAPLVKEKVSCYVACTIEEEGVISLKDYAMYNPLKGLGI